MSKPAYIQVARMPRLIQQDFSERRGEWEDERGVMEGLWGGRRNKERGEWEEIGRASCRERV